MEKKFVDYFQDWVFLSSRINQIARNLSCHDIRQEALIESQGSHIMAERENLPVTSIEMRMGMRSQLLEKQVRDAVLTIHGGGRTTYNSGFWGTSGWQRLDFVTLEPPSDELLRTIWSLTDETGILTYTYPPVLESSQHEDSLSAIYAEREQSYLWTINFWDATGDIGILTEHWDTIATFLPPSDEPRLIRGDQIGEVFRATHTLRILE